MTTRASVNSHGRANPIDVEAAQFQGLKPGVPVCSDSHADADADVNRNLQRFTEKPGDPAAAPSREKGYPKGIRP